LSRIAAKLRINYPLLFGTRRIAALYGVTNTLLVTIIVGRQGMLEGRIDGITDLREIKKFFNSLSKKNYSDDSFDAARRFVFATRLRMRSLRGKIAD